MSPVVINVKYSLCCENGRKRAPGPAVGGAPAALQSADVFSAPVTTWKHIAPLAC